MKRRSFLAVMFAAPAAVVATQIEANPESQQLADIPPLEDVTALPAMMAASIGSIHAGVIRTKSGNMCLDLDRGCIILRD